MSLPRPFFERRGFTLHHGDMLDMLPLLAADSIDAVVTDPPYGLQFMGKDWDKGVPGIHFWEAAIRVAKPGAHLLAFGGTRTYHRLACAIEDAGWEIRDCLMWLYGSGFPKSLDISKQLDRRAGVGRPDALRGGHMGYMTSAGDGQNENELGNAVSHRVGKGGQSRGLPVTGAALRWQGWGTALKPAWEPIILARKPLTGTVAGNVLAHGTGALNIDGCRIDPVGLAVHRTPGNAAIGQHGIYNGGWDAGKYEAPGEGDYVRYDPSGRWPANLILDEEAAAMLDEQSGTTRTGGSPTRRLADKTRHTFGEFKGSLCVEGQGPSEGGASRFFYTAKASRSERGKGNDHPTVKPLSLMRYLCRLVTPPDGLILDPFAGSCTTGRAAVLEGFRFVGVELEEHNCRVAVGRFPQEVLPL